MKKLLSVGFALGCSIGVAQAAPIITFTGGSGATPAGLTVVQNFDSFTAGSSLPGGTNVVAYSASLPTRPAFAPTTGNYASVQTGGSYTISFAPTNTVAFNLGSLDTYNVLTLTYADNTITVLNGGQIIGGTTAAVVASGSTTSPLTNGEVVIQSGTSPLIKSLTFGSTDNSFEFDNVAAAPEPAAWGMMILGFGLVGGVLRRRPSLKVKYA